MHSLQIFYKPDRYPKWVEWKVFTHKFSSIGKPGLLDAGGIPSARAGFAPRISLGKPANDCDPQSTNRRLRRGYTFQVLLKGTGHATVEQFRLHAQKLVERSRGISHNAK